MKKNISKKLSVIISIVLIAVMALMVAGCSKGIEDTNSTTENSTVSSTETANIQPTEIGEGEKKFTFTVTDVESEETVFSVSSNKETVGEALQELKLIDGEEGQFGLYVKTVNGITYDFAKDGKYWAFYENGKIAPVGADSTKITDGANYAFKAE